MGVKPRHWPLDFNIKSRYYLQMPHYQQKTHCKVWWARKLQTNNWLAPNETQHMHTFKKSMATDWPIGKKLQTSITREALEWDPLGQRKQERPFHSWKGIRNDTHDLVVKQREQLKQSEMESNCSGPILHTEWRGLSQVSTCIHYFSIQLH